jgi:hypothetical protein
VIEGGRQVRDGQTLREVVEAQAKALVAGDLASFASYAMPQALPLLYRNRSPIPARAFDILDVDMLDRDIKDGVDMRGGPGAQGRSEVRFRGTWSYVMRGSWERTDAGWKAVALDIPPASMRTALWRRLLLRSANPAPIPQREDLS